MGWFDEQIELRKNNDERELEDSLLGIAGTVIGKKHTMAYKDDKWVIKNAIDTILKFYHINPVTVPDELESVDDQLEYVLRPNGIMRRVVKLEKGWYRNAFGAMLGIKKDDGSIVALLPYGMNGYYYYDYNKQKKIHINRHNESMFDEEAECFYTTFPLRKISIKDVFMYCIKLFTIADYAMIVAACMLATCIGLFVPYINKIIFSNVVYSEKISTLIAITVFLLCVSVSSLIFTTLQSIVSSRISMKMDVTVEAATMIRVLSLPPDFFKEFSSGELTTRIQYLNSLCDIFINSLVQTGLTSVFSLVYIIQVVNYAPVLVIPSLLVTLATIIVSIASTLVDMKYSKIRMERSAKVSGMSFALISGIQKIKLSGAEKRAFARWGKEYAGLADVTYNYPVFVKLNSVIQTGISLIGTLIMYYLAIKSSVSVADYYAFNSAYACVSGAFIALSSITTVVAQIKPIIEMLQPIFDAVPEISERKTVVNNLSGGIEISNVCFRYSESMPYVLDDMSLKIRPGQYVAIVGKTGCGKSTLMRLLLGFETPQKGAIYYDGKDLNSLDVKSLRKNMGVVLQNGTLFSGDLFSNITISAPLATIDDAWEAARLAGMEDDIRNMPMGMYTMVAEGGGGISGGQKQRIMIARAVASKPKILMFDEATSALDNITQRIVSESLKTLKCTRIVIAHRLSTIKDCDRIIVLDGGKIIEDGTYDELIKKEGYFADLVRRQRIDSDTE